MRSRKKRSRKGGREGGRKGGFRTWFELCDSWFDSLTWCDGWVSGEGGREVGNGRQGEEMD